MTTVTLHRTSTYRLLAFHRIQGGPDDGMEITIAYPLHFGDAPETDKAAAQRATDYARLSAAVDDLEAWDTEQDAKARPCIAYRRRTYAPETIAAAQAEVERLRAEWATQPASKPHHTPWSP